MSLDYEYIFKYIIVGDSGVGKSSILIQFIDKRFSQLYNMTIGVEFGTRVIDVDDRKFKIQIWDTAGQESFKSITRAYYRESAAVLLVYDVTNSKSFKSIGTWYEDVRSGTNDPQMILVGNKSDLEHDRHVTFIQGRQLAKNYGMIFIETSAKNRDNIDEAFTMVTKNIIKQIDDNHINIEDSSHGIKRGSLVRFSNAKPINLATHDHQSFKCC